MSKNFVPWFLVLQLLCPRISGQEYEVTDINCRQGKDDFLTAKLRKPVGFKGVPIFADERSINPLTSINCQIRPDISDPTGLGFILIVNDFSKCGTIVGKNFINVRVWFPMLPSLIMMSDQEVIIMCKPQSEKSLFSAEESPRENFNLDYVVSIYREKNEDPRSLNNLAVPIGTRLQLRATINTQSVWKHIKLLEVSLSPNKNNPYAPGHVLLLRDGCRELEFSSIIPDDPKISSNSTGEVHLDFEAVMLDANRDRTSQVFIHARSKACRRSESCQPSDCVARNLRGKRETGSFRLKLLETDEILVSKEKNRRPLFKKIEYFAAKEEGKEEPFAVNFGDEADKKQKEEEKDANFIDNVGLTVVMPTDEYYSPHNAYQSQDDSKKGKLDSSQDCKTFLGIGVAMGCLLIIASVMMCILAQKLHKTVTESKSQRAENIFREHRRMGLEPGGGGGLYRSDA